MTGLFSVVNVCIFVPSFGNIYIYIYNVSRIQVPVTHVHDFLKSGRTSTGSTSHTDRTLSDDDAAAAEPLSLSN